MGCASGALQSSASYSTVSGTACLFIRKSHELLRQIGPAVLGMAWHQSRFSWESSVWQMMQSA